MFTFSIDLPGNIKIKNPDGSINNGMLMEAQKIAQAVFDELYENDPKSEYENNNMEKPLERPNRRYLKVSKKRRFK